MAEISLHTPYPAAEVAAWDMETDIVIIGFGATGACAAIEAKQAGADVKLFERNSGSGGASGLSGGEIYLGGNGGTARSYAFYQPIAGAAGTLVYPLVLQPIAVYWVLALTLGTALVKGSGTQAVQERAASVR